jgi:hypothetical protein
MKTSKFTEEQITNPLKKSYEDIDNSETVFKSV